MTCLHSPVTERTTIGELCSREEFKPVSDLLFTNMTPDVWNNPLEHYGFEKCGFLETLERIAQLTAFHKPYVYDVYPQSQCSAHEDKSKVKLVHMPGKPAMPYAVICPGGAYARQWGLIEGLAVGARLNQWGIPCFVLYYRTAQKPLLPKPIRDLAAAIRFIDDNSKTFQVQSGHYAVGGFSAGGHLAAEWGTVNHGWKTYGLTKPEALFLGYPSISTDVFFDALPHLDRDSLSTASNYLARLSGEAFTREALREYSVDCHMDRDYPPVFLTACKDDPVVPFESSERFMERLTQLQIPYETAIGETGGHSFGLGDGTETDGWLQKAVAFWNRQRVSHP